MNNTVTIVGAGLAGCEAAWQLARRGVRVHLIDMKPVKFSPAHRREGFAELVCSNSLKAEQLSNASGLLKAEMRALDGLILMREQEGERMCADILEKIGNIERLRDGIAALTDGEIDEARLLTEVAIFADRAAIDEELVRLKSHAAAIRETAALAEPVGRKLDFLVQELNREVNTIGSKASDTAIAQAVVSAKGEIEKLREQVQNVE